ncbi:MAG: transposase [Candidatus Binatia bacterium]
MPICLGTSADFNRNECRFASGIGANLGRNTQARGFRRFSLRGEPKVGLEWQLICLTHNLLKLFRAKVCLQGA